MVSPNPLKTCETCVFGQKVPDTYSCAKPIAKEHSRGLGDEDTVWIYQCPKDLTYINNEHYGDILGRDKKPPKNESCLDCELLQVSKFGTVVCNVTSRRTIQFLGSWCGQWQPKGSF